MNVCSLFKLNHRGSSIIDGLVAAAILATAVTGTASLAQYLVKQSRRAQAMNRAVTLQAKLQGALFDKRQFDADNAAIAPYVNLMNPATGGQSPVNMPIYEDPVGMQGLLGTVGRRQYFTVDGATCNDGEPGCVIYVDLDIQCNIVTASSCRAAYRVGIKPEQGDTPVAALGSLSSGPSAGPTFKNPTDYILPVSYDSFYQLKTSACPAADASGRKFVGVSGVNRFRGNVSCLYEPLGPADECPAPNLARAIVAKGGVLKYVCVPLGYGQCPRNYVFEGVDLGTLDANYAAGGGGLVQTAGSCVYRWRDKIPWQRTPGELNLWTSSASTASVKTCNKDVYYSTWTSGCAYEERARRDVNCPRTCTCGTAESGFYPCDCSCTASSVVTVTQSQLDPDNDRVTCSISVKHNSCFCGTSYVEAKPVATGQCVTKESKNNPSLRKQPQPAGGA